MNKILVLVGLVWLIGCDPVRGVLSNPGKTKRIAAEYMRQFSFSDSFACRPGLDTVVLIDTTWLGRAGLYHIRETRIVVDTFAHYDRAQVRAMQSVIRGLDSVILAKNAIKNDLNKKVEKQRWMIAGLISAMVAGVAFVVGRRLRK